MEHEYTGDEDCYEEIDVYLNVKDNENLYFLQYPTVPFNSLMYGYLYGHLSEQSGNPQHSMNEADDAMNDGAKYNLSIRENVQLKPKSCQLELDIPLCDSSSGHQNFSMERAREFSTKDYNAAGKQEENNDEYSSALTSLTFASSVIQCESIQPMMGTHLQGINLYIS